MLRLLPLALLAVALPALAQPSDGPLAVAVDCPGYVPGCDLDFFQTEVGFARFVRDQADAAVYVLVVREGTGGGGDRYTLFFDGRRAPLAGRRDTLRTSTPPGASDDDQRRGLRDRLALGLAGFAARTGLANRLSVSYTAPDAAQAATEAADGVDPWNSWVFRINAQGYFSGQSQSSSSNLFGSVSAERVTEALKVSIRPRASYNRSEFELSDGSPFVSDNASYGLNSGVVVSLSDHWSAGGRVDLSRNTFSNYDARAEVTPAVEYNLYPYAESTQRQLRFFYQAGVEAVAYQDTTVFLETSAVLPVHEGGVAAEFAQPWGSVDIYSSASQYLSRTDRYNLSLGGGVELRLLRGLSLRVDGYYEFVRDQINLRAARAEDGQILTGDQELPTGFQYFASVGVSYSFGSIYNQVVNARFGN
ncbi:hypothetical protein [Rubrivirga sp.]|uniref:hypothetical protein n=1 Tax=Rubrivirga sp. TaxID=1885344 RepID=UPI003B517397